MRRSITAAAFRIVFVLSATTIPGVSVLSAQSLRQQTSVPVPLPTQVISTNPFLPLFGYFQAEYERVIAPNATFAVASSYINFDNSYFTNFDAKVRLYPNEHAPEGLGLAASLGVANVRRDYGGFTCVVGGDNIGCDRGKVHQTVPAFAIEGDYQWMLGPRKATAVTVGFGVKRYFASESDFSGTSRVLPTGRLSIGYAFR